MSIAYLDLPSGISGDMFLGCLISAGWRIEHLRRTLDMLSLPEGSLEVRAEQVKRKAFSGTLVHVITSERTHVHRHLSDIEKLINESELNDNIKSRVIATFTRLAQAEASVHGTEIDKIHFHEVGALDSIADIVGVCAGLEELGIDQVFSSSVPLGDGWIDTAHGRMPLPGPATLAILASVNAPTRPAPGPGELVTPTGAALLAEYACFRQPVMNIRKVGFGVGTTEFDWPNIARMWLGETAQQGPLVQIDTNIDDMNPQLLEAVRERLMDAGAIDIWYSPIQMKKGRPALTVSLLVDTSRETAVAEVLLRETTTLGMRVHPVYRHEARQGWDTVTTPYGQITIKLKWIGDELSAAVPEYKECQQRAEECGVSVREVLESASAAAWRFRHELSSKM